MQIINIIAVLLSPIIAVLVTLYLQNRSEKLKNKMQIFNILIRSRHQVITEDMVSAYNMIDVVFFNDTKVRKLWREYYELLGNNAVNYQNKEDKRLELIHEMAKVLGYGKAINHIDITRVYYPTGLAVKTQRNEDTADELLRVLKASNGLLVIPKDHNEA